jgi:hypothetical protein
MVRSPVEGNIVDCMQPNTLPYIAITICACVQPTNYLDNFGPSDATHATKQTGEHDSSHVSTWPCPHGLPPGVQKLMHPIQLAY